MRGKDDNDTATEEDIVSDPHRADEEGSDWTDEGGATPRGPATDTPAE